MRKQNKKSVSRYTSLDELIRQCLDWERPDAQGVEGGGFNVGKQRTLDICSYNYLFGGTEEKIDEKSMQLNLTLWKKSESQEKIHTS